MIFKKFSALQTFVRKFVALKIFVTKTSKKGFRHTTPFTVTNFADAKINHVSGFKDSTHVCAFYILEENGSLSCDKKQNISKLRSEHMVDKNTLIRWHQKKEKILIMKTKGRLLKNSWVTNYNLPCKIVAVLLLFFIKFKEHKLKSLTPNTIILCIYTYL